MQRVNASQIALWCIVERDSLNPYYRATKKLKKTANVMEILNHTEPNDYVQFRNTLHVLLVDKDSITWWRICNVIVAARCMADLTGNLLEYASVTGEFLDRFCTDWVNRNGGWETMASRPSLFRRVLLFITCASKTEM